MVPFREHLQDIRAQLPDHSKQFDTIDSDFKVSCVVTTHLQDTAHWFV